MLRAACPAYHFILPAPPTKPFTVAGRHRRQAGREERSLPRDRIPARTEATSWRRQRRGRGCAAQRIHRHLARSLTGCGRTVRVAELQAAGAGEPSAGGRSLRAFQAAAHRDTMSVPNVAHWQRKALNVGGRYLRQGRRGGVEQAERVAAGARGARWEHGEAGEGIRGGEGK